MGIRDMFPKIFNKEGEKGSESDEESGLAASVEKENIEGDNINKSLEMQENSQVVGEHSQVNNSQKEVDEDITKASEANQSSISETPTSSPEQVTKEKVLDVLSDVYDPEIPIDIVNLGLIYGVDIEDGNVHVKMTMTAPGCPASAEITAESKILIEELPGVKSAYIEIVWDPPWDPSRMSEEAKQSMGM